MGPVDWLFPATFQEAFVVCFDSAQAKAGHCKKCPALCSNVGIADLPRIAVASYKSGLRRLGFPKRLSPSASVCQRCQ